MSQPASALQTGPGYLDFLLLGVHGIACCILRISMVKAPTQWGFQTGPSLSSVVRSEIFYRLLSVGPVVSMGPSVLGGFCLGHWMGEGCYPWDTSLQTG